MKRETEQERHQHHDGHAGGTGHDHAGDHAHLEQGHGHDHGHEKSGQWTKLRHKLSHFVPFSHSHDSVDSVDEALETSARGIRAIKVSLLALGVTTLIQVAIYLVSGSVALLADTLHNFVDAVNGIPLWIALAFAGRAATRRYTYGYGRAEDLAGLFIVVLIAVSAVLAGYETIQKLLDPEPMSNVALVAVAAVVGFVGNELVARYEMSVGRQIGSAALIADGQHARVDGFTSLAVLGAAVGVWLGYPIVDPIFGLLITVAILGIVWSSARSMWRRMMDGIEPEIVDSIEVAVEETEGVKKVESVRARWVGHRVHSEVEIVVDGTLSASEVAGIRGSIFAEARRAVPKLERLVVEATAC